MKRDGVYKLFQDYVRGRSDYRSLTSLFSSIRHLNEDHLRAILDEEFSKDNLVDDNITSHTDLLYPLIEQRINSSPGRRLRIGTSSQTLWFKMAACVLMIISFSLIVNKYIASKNSFFIPGEERAELLIGAQKLQLNSYTQNSPIKTHGVRITHLAKGIISYHVDAYDSSAAAVLNKVTTPRGGEYSIRLSDGTKIKLNAGSSLEFPVGFYGKSRTVKLHGEAYFEVAKDRSKPFIVEVGLMSVKVLGTHFNISSYAEEKGIRTSLSQGKIAILSREKQLGVLVPGEQALFNQGTLSIAAIDTLETNAWVNGTFVFNDRSLKFIIAKLARWYNFEYDESALPDLQLYVRIKRNMSFNEVLNVLNTSTELKFGMDGRVLRIQ